MPSIWDRAQKCTQTNKCNLEKLKNKEYNTPLNVIDKIKMMNKTEVSNKLGELNKFNEAMNSYSWRIIDS